MLIALLLRGKFVLILDDLWNHFDAEEVGIPINTKGCKLIITTWFSDVCTRMNLKMIEKVEPFPKKRHGICLVRC